MRLAKIRKSAWWASLAVLAPLAAYGGISQYGAGDGPGWGMSGSWPWQRNAGYVSGLWYPSFVPLTPANGSASASTNLRCTPYIVDVPGMKIDQVGVYISTADAAGFLSIALYTNDVTSGRPAPSVLIDSVGSAGISTASTGGVAANMANGVDNLPSGAYWTCVSMTTSTAVLFGVGAAASIMGSPTLTTAIGAGNTTQTGLYCTLGVNGCGPTWSGSTYAWPSTLSPSSWGNLNTAGNSPGVGLRVH